MNESILKSPDTLLTQIKFLLRRVENDIDCDQSLEELVELYKNEHLDFELVQSIIERDVIHKGNVCNALGVYFFSSELYEDVIPLLKNALSYDKDNVDFLYNLGYVLAHFGEKELALQYLNRMQDQDEKVRQLINELSEG